MAGALDGSCVKQSVAFLFGVGIGVMSTIKGEIKRGKPPRKPRGPVERTAAGVKVIPITQRYRDNYDGIKWGRS